MFLIHSVLLGTLPSTVIMGRKKTNFIYGWPVEEREYCVQKYYDFVNNGASHYMHRFPNDPFDVVKCWYWMQFHERNETVNREKCPSSDHIMAWVKMHEEKQKLAKSPKSASSWKQTQEQQKTKTNKLSGTQWGRKMGENRIVRTESVDMGAQQQAVKWKEGETKWCGPRPCNETRKLEVPVVEGWPRWWYSPPDEEEEAKPDKKQAIKKKFEGEILDLIESLDAHGHAARASAFMSLRAALQRRAVDGLLAAHRATLAEHVSRALRRGKDGERKAAAGVAPLLALQIGEEAIEQFVREVRPALCATATDESTSLETRSECCSSLAVLCYLVEEDLTEILEVMRMYESIFSGSYLKDDGSMKVSGAAVEEGAWHAAALDGWALLLPLLSPNHALSLLNNHAPSFARLRELLEAVSLEVRMAAGGALAIAYETVSDDDNSDNPLAAHVDVLLPRLTELVRDSRKSLAKKHRKMQRASFRDILKYFEEGSAPSGSAHIGTETATWCGWSRGAAHAALAGALGGALPVLAPHCPRLRDALQLPDESHTETSSREKPIKVQQEKPKKLQRHLQHRAASKARNYTRSKNRDKRSAAHTA